MKRRAPGRWPAPLAAGYCFCLMGLVAQTAGCGAAARGPFVRVEPAVERPASAVLLITVDGLAEARFDEFLAAGDLPNIKRLLIDRGVRVRRAVASQPSITYANLTTILTGQYAGHHGIVGNKWFDRYALVYRDYTTMATYRLVGDDYPTPTVFDCISPARSASIQCANRRGASRTIDNWASSGIRWFFGALQDVDRLVPLRMELIAESANAWGVWPALIHAYMPAVDEIGHRYGDDSPQYRDAVINADGQVGRLFKAIGDAGMLDRTCVVLVSDHGHLAVPPNRYFDLADHLRRRSFKVQDRPTGVTSFERRRRHYAGVDAVLVVGGDRRAVIHLPGPRGWHQRPEFATVERLIDPAVAGTVSLWNSPAVKLALAPRGDPSAERRTVEVYSRLGHARLGRRRVEGRMEYGYEVVTTDALGGAIPTGWYDAETWLSMTVDTPYPDFVVPLVELFDSPRAGDIMLVAEKGWDFAAGNGGGHGGVEAAEVLVPMIFAGAGLPAGQTIDQARLVDLAPTIMGLIAGGEPPGGQARFDGLDRTDMLRSAGRDSGGLP